MSENLECTVICEKKSLTVTSRTIVNACILPGVKQTTVNFVLDFDSFVEVLDCV